MWRYQKQFCITVKKFQTRKNLRHQKPKTIGIWTSSEPCLRPWQLTIRSWNPWDIKIRIDHCNVACRREIWDQLGLVCYFILREHWRDDIFCFVLSLKERRPHYIYISCQFPTWITYWNQKGFNNINPCNYITPLTLFKITKLKYPNNHNYITLG